MERREFLKTGTQILLCATIAGSTGVWLSGCETDVLKTTGTEILIDLNQYPELSQVNGIVFIQKENTPLIVIRKSDTQFAAYSAICPHQGCLIGDQPGELMHQRIKCMCHGAEFNPMNGAVLMGPATSGLREYRTEYDPSQNMLKIFV